MTKKDFFPLNKNEIISKTIELINIPSVYDCSSSFVFGQNINNALEYILKLR